MAPNSKDPAYVLLYIHSSVEFVAFYTLMSINFIALEIKEPKRELNTKFLHRFIMFSAH